MVASQHIEREGFDKFRIDRHSVLAETFRSHLEYACARVKGSDNMIKVLTVFLFKIL